MEKQLKALSTTYSYTSGGATTPAADLGRAAADLAVARSGRGGGGSGAPVRATRSFGRGGGGRSRDASPVRRTRSFGRRGGASREPSRERGGGERAARPSSALGARASSYGNLSALGAEATPAPATARPSSAMGGDAGYDSRARQLRERERQLEKSLRSLAKFKF